MRNHVLFLLIVLFCSIKTMAQIQRREVAGQVVDSLSNKGLPNATINLISLSDGKSYKAISNNSGYYSFKGLASGDYSLAVDYVGYLSFKNEKTNIVFGTEPFKIPTISLRLDQKNLKAVTVSAAKPFIVQGVDKNILNVAESPIAAGGNAYDVVLRAPGVIEQNNSLNFRSRSVQVYINNRPSHLSGEDLKNMLTSMPANSIEQIEVIPNPSSKYDANGGAIINIVLAKNKNFGANYTINGGIGEGRFFKDNLGIDGNYRNKSINIIASYNYVNNEQYYDNYSIRYLNDASITSHEYDVRSRFNNSYKVGLDYDIDKTSSIGFLLNGYVNIRDRNVTDHSGVQYIGNPYDSASQVLTQGWAKFASPSLNVYYKKILDTTRKEIDINADYFNLNQMWNDNFSTDYFDKTGSEYMPTTFLKDNSPENVNVYSITADYTQPTKRGKWEAGIKSAYTVTDNNFLWQDNNGSGWTVDTTKTNHFVYKENINAAYLNYIFSIKKYYVQLGLRGEQTNTEGNLITLNQISRQHYFNIFPNASINYTRNLNNVFSLSYRKSITRFGFNVVNPFIIYQNQYSYMQGNPNIEPQIEHTISFSYTYKQFLSFGMDYVHVSKMLNQVYDNAPNNVIIQTYNNLSSGDVGDFYVTVSKQVGFWSTTLSNIGGYGAYNLTPTNASTSQEHSSGWLFYSQWQNNFTFKKGWSAEMSSFYSAPMVYAAYNIHHLFYTNIGVSKSLLKKAASIKLSVSDVFNTQKQISTYNSMGVDLYQNNKAESMFVNLSFKYKFGNKNVRGKMENQSKISDIKSRLSN